MKCPECGKDHEKDHPHFKDVKKLDDKGFPTHSPDYQKAHRAANRAEKKEFGEKSFKALEKYYPKVGKHGLEGKNFKSGKIEVSEQVPKRFRDEVAFHERFENNILRKKR